MNENGSPTPSNNMTTGIIIVLGCSNDANGNLSSMALERCTQAVEVFQDHPSYLILPTGGWGEHFNTTDMAHGIYVKEELIRRGVPASVFLPCAESTNTIEDATLSRPIVDKHPNADLIVVTSDFHEARARYLFEREFPERKLTLSTSVTHMSPEELAQRRAHEERALNKLKSAAQHPDDSAR